MKPLFWSLFAVQALDAAIHIRSGEVELVRLLASVLLLGAALVAVWRLRPVGNFGLVSVALSAYLALNAFFIVQSGWPGIVFWLLVAATSLNSWLILMKLRHVSSIKKR